MPNTSYNDFLSSIISIHVINFVFGCVGGSYIIGKIMSTINSMETEENEVILYTLSLTDILEKIFSYLNFKDLRQVSNTCRLWREIANKELSLRNDFESLILPLYITPYVYGVGYDDGEDFFEYYNNIIHYRRLNDGVAEWHVSNVVRNLPKMFFLFYEAQTLLDLPFHREYLETLPKSNDLVTIGLLMLSLDNTEIFGFSNLGAGISMPSTPSLKSEFINIDQYKVDYLSIDELMEETCDTLKIYTTEEQNSCFIIFLARIYDSVLDWHAERSKVHVENFMKNIKRRYTPGSYSIFGSGCYFIDVFSANSGAEDMNYSFILRLYGPAIKSWSIVLNLDLPSSEARQRLLDFRKNIRLRSNTIAIAALPVDRERAFCCVNNDQLSADMWLCKIQEFKQVFPKVPLTCMFDDQLYPQYGCNTLIDGEPNSAPDDDSI